MPHWKRTLNIKAEWEKAKRDEMSVYELAQAIARKLQALYPDTLLHTCGPLGELWDIISDFDDLPEDAEDSDFNYIFQNLYDWADTGHRLWVKTWL